MTKDEILARWKQHGGALSDADPANTSITTDGLVAFVQGLLELPPGTIEVQATQIRFGGGVSAFPANVLRAAERLANHL